MSQQNSLNCYEPGPQDWTEENIARQVIDLILLEDRFIERHAKEVPSRYSKEVLNHWRRVRGFNA